MGDEEAKKHEEVYEKRGEIFDKRRGGVRRSGSSGGDGSDVGDGQTMELPADLGFMEGSSTQLAETFVEEGEGDGSSLGGASAGST